MNGDEINGEAVVCVGKVSNYIAFSLAHFIRSLRNGTRKFYDVECDISLPLLLDLKAAALCLWRPSSGKFVFNGQLLMGAKAGMGRLTRLSFLTKETESFKPR